MLYGQRSLTLLMIHFDLHIWSTWWDFPSWTKDLRKNLCMGDFALFQLRYPQELRCSLIGFGWSAGRLDTSKLFYCPLRNAILGRRDCAQCHEHVRVGRTVRVWVLVLFSSRLRGASEVKAWVDLPPQFVSKMIREAWSIILCGGSLARPSSRNWFLAFRSEARYVASKLAEVLICPRRCHY